MNIVIQALFVLTNLDVTYVVVLSSLFILFYLVTFFAAYYEHCLGVILGGTGLVSDSPIFRSFFCDLFSQLSKFLIDLFLFRYPVDRHFRLSQSARRSGVHHFPPNDRDHLWLCLPDLEEGQQLDRRSMPWPLAALILGIILRIIYRQSLHMLFAKLFTKLLTGMAGSLEFIFVSSKLFIVVLS